MKTLKYFLFFTGLCLHTAAMANIAYEDALKSFHQKQYNETIIHLKNALKEDIDHIPSRLLLSETLIAQGKGEMAETELYDLQARGVDFNQVVALLAQSLVLQSKYKRVLDIATPGYRGNRIESQIYFARGQAYLGLNQLRQAEKAFNESLLLEPDFQLAMLGIAQVAINQNNLSKANEYVDKALNSYEPLINTLIMKSTLFQIQGLNEQAITAIDKAILKNPQHLQARLNRASLHIGNESWLKAAQDLDYILEKIPQEPRAKYLRAIVSAKSGNSADSKAKLNEVIVTLNAIPDTVMMQNPSYLFLAGVTNFNFGNLEDALHYFKDYLKVKENDFNSLRYIAIIELKQGKPENAKNLLSKAKIYYPDSPALLSLLGIALMEVGKVEQAKYYFEEVVKLTPNYSSALSNLAQSEIISGDYTQAINNLLNAKKGDKNNTAITLLLVEAYLKTKQYEKAKVLTNTLITTQTDNSYFHQQHGIALGYSGDIAGARSAFEKAIELQPQNNEAVIHLARMEFVEQGPQRAIELLQKALNEQPENIQLMVELANIHMKNQEPSKALQLYQQAFDFDNQNAYTLTKLVDFYFATNQHAKAESILLAYTQKHPKNSDVKIKLGQVYNKLNQPLKAIKIFKSAIPDSLDRIKTYMLLAQVQLKIDDRDAAIQSLNKAIAWDEKRLEPLMMLFPIALSKKDYVRAEQVIYSINKLIPNQDVTDVLSAQLFEAQEDYKKAEQSYRNALKKYSSRKSTIGLFNALNQQKRFKESHQLIEKWLISNPRDLLAEIALAESFTYQKKLAESLNLYQSLIEKYKRMPILLNNAANVALRLNKIDLAKNYASEAYAKANSNVSIIDTYAWIQAQTGQRDEAITLFRKALVLDFKNAEVKYHLALTLKQVNRDREAYKLLSESVKSEQVFNDKSKARQMLEEWKKAKS